MNKRQRNKKKKKYLPIIADEFNLLTMTPDELTKAHADYQEFKERYAYRKKYKDLKEGKPLRYFYPIGEKYADANQVFSNITSSKSQKVISVTQNLNHIKK